MSNREMQKSSKAFGEGRDTYVPKKTPSCPHEDGTQACSDWWEGFRDARASVKKEKGDV